MNLVKSPVLTIHLSRFFFIERNTDVHVPLYVCKRSSPAEAWPRGKRTRGYIVSGCLQNFFLFNNSLKRINKKEGQQQIFPRDS